MTPMAFTHSLRSFSPAFAGINGKALIKTQATGTYGAAALRIADILAVVNNNRGPANLILSDIRFVTEQPGPGGLFLDAPNEIVRFGPVTAATLSGTTATITIGSGHNIQTGERITIRQVEGAVELNGIWGPTLSTSPNAPVIRRVSDTQFTISGVASITAFTTSANSIVEVERPFPAVALTSYTVATKLFTTAAAHGLRAGDMVVVSQVTGMTGAIWLNRVSTVATVPSSTTFTIRDAGAATGTSSGGVVIRVRTLNNFGLLRAFQPRVLTPTGITAADPAVFTFATNHRFRIGDRVVISSVQGTSVTALMGAFRVRTTPLATTATFETEAGVPVSGSGATITANTGLVLAPRTEFDAATLVEGLSFALEIANGPSQAPIYTGPFNA